MALSRDAVLQRAQQLQARPSVESWVGRGVRFPWRPDERTGRLEYVTGEEIIRQAIETILDTEPGERIMLPAFGCGLRRYLMEPNITVTRAAIARDITDALTRWEPRIRLTDVTVTADQDPSLLWIRISYLRRADRRPDNLVYPFYLATRG